VLALGAGVGSVAVAESMSSVVRGSKKLTAILRATPLAVIPYLPNTADAMAQTRQKKLLIISGVVGIIILLLLVQFMFSPLDVLWFRGVRKVEDIIGN